MTTEFLFDQYVIPTYRRFPLTIVRGEGAKVWDETGKEYLDFGAGVAVCALGHAHPAITEALTTQAGKLIHCSNLYWSKPQGELAKYLAESVVEASGKSFFCNSGAEATEGLIKLARKFGQHTPNTLGTSRYEMITFEKSFHGRTLGGISAGAQAKIKAGFEPLVPGFKHVPLNDIEALRGAISQKTAAILLEPVQGEGGIWPAKTEFLLQTAEICKEHDLLLMLDEVQCGLGRAGHMCAWKSIVDEDEIQPDAVAWAKGLGGGFPIGAIWASSRELENEVRVCDLLGPGTHGSTFGGSPLACSVALAVLKEISENDLAGNANGLGGLILTKARELDLPFVREVRGLGLMIGFEIDAEAIASLPACEKSGDPPSLFVINELTRNGLLTVPAGPDVVRWLPPLNITKEDVEKAFDIFASTLKKLAE